MSDDKKTMHEVFIEKDHPRWDTIGGGLIHKGETEPESRDALWVDTADESVDEIFQTDLSQDIVDLITETKEKIDRVSYAIDYEIDPGYFLDRLPGTDPDLEIETDPNAPDLGDGAAGTVNRIMVKRGLKEDLMEEGLHEGEFGWCIDTEELYIGNKGLIKLVARVGGIGGSTETGGNVTADYVELVSKAGNRYRLTVNDEGEPIIINSEGFNSTPPAASESGRFKGLYVNKVYGGGARDTNATPVSHSFIELYNTTDNTMNLNGLSLQYAEYLGQWQVLPLNGTIKPYSSFVIRGAQHSDPYRRGTRFKIMDYDMSWDIPISSSGYKIYLKVGTEPSQFTNPANTDGQWTKETGYISLFAAGGEDVSRVIDGYERGYLHIVNSNRMLKRRFSDSTTTAFANTGYNDRDIEYLDMREADIDIYTPRAQSFGQWYLDYNQLKLKTHAPNVVNICFGYDGDTTRTFTWQSQVVDEGYVYYKEKGTDSWTIVESNRKFVAMIGEDVTIHSAIVRNLVPGKTYIYKVGFEGCWSDEWELPILDKRSQDSNIKILWTSDQQSWDKETYWVWKKAAKYIEKTETDYDFHINTGDIAQNGNRPFEWREYYEGMKNHLSTHPHMTVVGNNDLVDKLYSYAYEYYSTVENSPYPSVYSFNYGFMHWVALDSNILNDPLDASKPIRALAEQIEFIKEDLAKPENQKRWRGVIIHESCYTIVRVNKLKNLINVLFDLGIDVVICGHHHCYTRSNRMGRLGDGDVDVIDNDNGVYYLMMQACGEKLSGKTIPTPDAQAIWRAKYDRPGDPCYATFEVTWDKIEFKAYRLTNIMPIIDNQNTEVVPILLDSLTITPKVNRT